MIAASLLGPDVSGTWNAKVETDAGSGTLIFVSKQSGEKLSGTYSGVLGEAQGETGRFKTHAGPRPQACLTVRRGLGPSATQKLPPSRKR
jgi:hypothetical protein